MSLVPCLHRVGMHRWMSKKSRNLRSVGAACSEMIEPPSRVIVVMKNCLWSTTGELFQSCKLGTDYNTPLAGAGGSLSPSPPPSHLGDHRWWAPGTLPKRAQADAYSSRWNHERPRYKSGATRHCMQLWTLRPTCGLIVGTQSRPILSAGQSRWLL